MLDIAVPFFTSVPAAPPPWPGIVVVMATRTLGKTGLPVSVHYLDAMRLGLRGNRDHDGYESPNLAASARRTN
jgi:hypothetical protein